jgi:riboflavin biosynthesis pyrimidine reductase
VQRRPAHAASLRALGVEVALHPARDLPAAFAALWANDVRSVLVEGGAALHRACIAHGLADRLHLYVTPHVLGPHGLPWDVGPCCLDVPERVVPLGPDVLIDTHVHRTH